MCSLQLPRVQRKHGDYQIIPLSTLAPQIVYLPHHGYSLNPAWGTVLCLLWLKGHFSGTPLFHKATFQLSTVVPDQMSMPPGSLSPPDFPPSLSVLHPTLISWKETFIGQGDSQQTCTLASVVINCNAFRLDVFFYSHLPVVSIVGNSSSFSL